MLLGNKGQIKKLKENLKYPILPYPLGETKRYNADYKPTSQMIMDFQDGAQDNKESGATSLNTPITPLETAQ